MLERQLEVMGKQNLAELENNLGLRQHTIVTALNSVQAHMDQVQEVLAVWEVSGELSAD